jgi:hypothetical protein
MIKKELDKIAQVEEQLFKLDEFKEVLVSQLQEVLIAQSKLTSDDPIEKIN